MVVRTKGRSGWIAHLASNLSTTQMNASYDHDGEVVIFNLKI
jgi:hypothetical protein